MAFRMGWMLCVVCVLGWVGTFQFGCQDKVECSTHSDCKSSHYACKEGKCVHDHSHHHDDKDGGGLSKHPTDAGDEGGVTDRGTDTKVTSDSDGVEHRDEVHNEQQVVQDKAPLVAELGRCNQQNKCDQGLACIVFSKGAKEGLCVRSVSSCTGAPCGAGYQCANLRKGEGVCLRLCSAGKPCPKQLQCKHLHFPGGHGDACVP